MMPNLSNLGGFSRQENMSNQTTLVAFSQIIFLLNYDCSNYPKSSIVFKWNKILYYFGYKAKLFPLFLLKYPSYLPCANLRR